MLQRVLVLEKNRETAERLEAALKRHGAASVSCAPTMREACLIVAQQPQDLALVPLEDSEQLLHSLRAFQPDLKLVLTTADWQAQFPNESEGVFEGLVYIGRLEQDIPALFGRAGPPPVVPEEGRESSAAPPPGLGRLKNVCLEIGLDEETSAAQTVIISFGEQMLGYFGQGSGSQALAVVETVSRSWRKGQFSAQLQYLQLPDYYDPRLIYSRGISGAVLSLVAEPDVPIGELRKLADRLARRLAGPGRKPAETVPSRAAFIDRGNGANLAERPTSTYAIAWRPVKPLPEVLQRIVEASVSLVAGEIGCVVRYCSVLPMVVHLVVKCPPGKTAAWAAYQIKSGIDGEIQSRFGTRATIWQKGFFATESEQLLNEGELNMLLAP